MPRPQGAVETDDVEFELLEEETKEMGKQDVAQCSASFVVLFCTDL